LKINKEEKKNAVIRLVGECCRRLSPRRIFRWQFRVLFQAIATAIEESA